MSICAALAATEQAKKSGVLSSSPACPRCFAVNRIFWASLGLSQAKPMGLEP